MSTISVSGPFDFVKSYDQASFENAHYAITQCELWDWIRDFDPPTGQGFMFCDTPELKRIKTAMFEHNDSVAGGHSGSSYLISRCSHLWSIAGPLIHRSLQQK